MEYVKMIKTERKKTRTKPLRPFMCTYFKHFLIVFIAEPEKDFFPN